VSNNEHPLPPPAPHTPPATPSPRQGGSPVSPGGHDIFTDPALAEPLQSDPVFRFIKDYWRQALLVIGMILAVAYARQVFRDTHVAEMERAADIFARARSEFEQSTKLREQLGEARVQLAEKESASAKGSGEKNAGAPPPAETEAAKSRVADLEKQLADSMRRLDGHLGALADVRSPYREFGQLYRGLAARAGAGDGGAVAEMRAAFGVPTGTVPLAVDPDLPTELKAMALAKALLDSPEGRVEGRNALAELAHKGVYVNVSAALALAHTASSGEERQAALTVLESIVAAHPEQQSLLGQEAARLRAAIR
jgi:hypothetical protein